MSIWVKTDDTIGVVALDNIQLSSRITPLEIAVNKLTSYESKSLTVNKTYCSTISSTYVRYTKFGRIVIVEIYDITLKGNKSSDGVATIASGLPKPAVEYTACLPTNTKTRNTEYVRIRVRSSGALQPWYIGATEEGTYINGTFTYISAS